MRHATGPSTRKECVLVKKLSVWANAIRLRQSVELFRADYQHNTVIAMSPQMHLSINVAYALADRQGTSEKPFTDRNRRSIATYNIL